MGRRIFQTTLQNKWKSCTPPNLPPRKNDDICNDYSYYDVNKGRCVCKGADAKEKEPEKYAEYPWGTVCVECESSPEDRSIVFILDGSGTVGWSGWQEQKAFMEQVLKHLKNVRVGVVVVSDVSFVAFKIDDYENIKDKVTYMSSVAAKSEKRGVSFCLTSVYDDYASESTSEILLIRNPGPP
ncbi:hypothetical protein Y032_0116g576 [Ancylostoma ceylanicum]|uniref:VWFA domain-containing protein n=1 Tax=Ancylostoma ceylanicum TaxID=53326 RepID=A0A016TCH4_9BILA|nr:hypothetical protein Y032_0116g576 [Ancylostoma ceylanicum]